MRSARSAQLQPPEVKLQQASGNLKKSFLVELMEVTLGCVCFGPDLGLRFESFFVVVP